MPQHKLFRVKEEIGKGFFGHIKIGRMKIDGKNKRVVVKAFKKRSLKELAELFEIDYNSFLEKFVVAYNKVIEELKGLTTKQKLFFIEGRLYLVMESYVKERKSKLEQFESQVIKDKMVFDQLFSLFMKLLKKGYYPTYDCFHINNKKILLSDLDLLVLQKIFPEKDREQMLKKNSFDIVMHLFFELVNVLNDAAKKHYKKNIVELMERYIKKQPNDHILKVIVEIKEGLGIITLK